ncbi:MAG: YfhO family protein [Chloroflexi bacterium]|nr:YfhO family protein [Chloroflexota bacterium]
MRRKLALRGWHLDGVAVLALGVLVVVFNPGLALEGRVLGGYDTFVYFYPLRAYFAEAISDGRLPLWNPRLFMGSPFLANPQTAIFYPGTWLFALLDVPHAYALNFLLHVFVAAVGVYAFARVSLGLGRIAALVGGAAFAFSGFLNGQAGHINQVSVAALVPLAALLLDLGLRTRRSLPFAGLTATLVLQILAGHPQEVYMTLVMLGLIVLWRSLPGPLRGVPRRLGRSLALLGGATLLALAISAIQLLPTAELAGLGTRGGGLDFRSAAFEALPWPLLIPALFPGYWAHLPTTEFFGHLGTVAFVVAWLGLLAGAGRPAALGAMLVALGLLLAVGDATPLYHWLFDWAPGFSSFRVPARWLLVSTTGLAILTAVGMDWLLRISVSDLRGLLSVARGVGWWRVGLAGGGVPLALLLLLVVGQPQSKWLLLVWGGVGILTDLLALAALMTPRLRPAALGLLAGALLVDLWFAGRALEYRQPVPNIAYGQPRESSGPLQQRLGGDSRFRMLSIATPEYIVKETQEYRERFSGLSALALQNLLVTVKWNETLIPNVSSVHRLASADGYDGGVLPLGTFVRFSQAMLGADRARPDGVLASRLDWLPETRWLDLMAVRDILASRAKDVTDGAIYYDRAISVTLRPGQRLELQSLPLGEFTRLGLITSYTGTARPGQEVGRVELRADTGASATAPLRDGAETAAATAQTGGLGGLERIEPWTTSGPDSLSDWLAVVGFSRQPVKTLAVVNTSSDLTLTVRSLNLIDDVRQAAFSLTLNSRIDRQEFFDVKVYDRTDALSRAYLVEASTILDDDATARRLADPSFDPRREVVLAPSDTGRTLGSAASTTSPVATAVEFEVDEPEHVRVRATVDRPSYLVLSDSWYPGWQAAVDGQDVPIERANLMFRAVLLDAGEHVVEFRYQPRAVWFGAAISALALIGSGAALAGYPVWRRRRHLAAES